MPGKGFYFTADEHLCASVGITEAVPFGSYSWCQLSSLGVPRYISCGVTGCFGLFGTEVYFREGLSNLCTFLLFLELIYCLLLLFI